MKPRDRKRNVPRDCWCGETNASVVGTIVDHSAKPWRLIKCDGCGVHLLDPPPTATELSAAYSADYYGATRKKFIGPVGRLIGSFQQSRARLVSLYVKNSGSVLDVGCGNGGFLRGLQQRGFATLAGTEWTAQSAARVPTEWGIPVHVGDLLQLDLPRASYDAITLWHVFEHLQQPDRTLERIAELLAPGGRLFIALPNQESWQARAYGPNWFHLDPPRHLFGFGPKSLRALLEAKGFEVESESTWSLEQNPYGILQSALNARGFPRDRAYSVLKGTAQLPAATRALDLLLVGALAPAALAASIVESAFGSGGTLTIVVRPRPEF